MNNARSTGVMFRRQLRGTVRKPVWLAVGLAQPVLYLALFGPLLGAFAGQLGMNPYTLLVPGLLVQQAVVGSLFVGFGLLTDLREGVLDAQRVTPASRWALLDRRTLHDVLDSAVQGLIEGRQDEFRDLADSFDDMLARLESHVAEQQRFAANASHELRTPLAVTQTLLDVARQDPDRQGTELDDRLREVNARAIELTEALLLLSQVDRRTFLREPVDLSLVAEEAVETLLPLAEKHGVELTCTGDVAPTSGSPALLLQLVTNLVHNAVVHNTVVHNTVVHNTVVHNTAERRTVRLVTAAGPGSVRLTVENTGEPLTPQLVATLTEPFQRGSARQHSDHAGVGLGLAIVASITRAHGGTLNLQPRPAGGLRVDVRLPRAEPGPTQAVRSPSQRVIGKST